MCSLLLRAAHKNFVSVELRVDMNAKKRELITISLLAAISGIAAWAFDHDLFALVFGLESIFASTMAFR
jgi:hypothetical protein